MYIIDRFEGDFAVIETDGRKTFDLPRALLPPDAREGDVLDITLSIDTDATVQRRENATKLLENFFDE